MLSTKIIQVTYEELDEIKRSTETNKQHKHETKQVISISTVNEVSDQSSQSSGSSVININDTLKDIPPIILSKLDEKIATLQQGLSLISSSSTSGWENFLEKDGLIAKKRYEGNNAVAVVRCELTIASNIIDVFSFFTNSNDLKSTGAMKKQQMKLQVFSKHSWVEYFATKELWPVSGRDFVDFTHWRYLKDGSILIVQYGALCDHLKPELTNPIRGNNIITGYILTPINNNKETTVLFLVQADPKGTLPATIVKNISLGQCNALLITKDIILKRSGSRKNNITSVTYGDIAKASLINLQDVGYEDRSCSNGNEQLSSMISNRTTKELQSNISSSVCLHNDIKSLPPPSILNGWIKIQRRFHIFGIFKNWKKIYFILTNGIITYYKEERDAMLQPSELDIKGKSFNLLNSFIIEDSKKYNIKTQIYIFSNSEHTHLLLEQIDNESYHTTNNIWKNTIQEHIKYANSSNNTNSLKDTKQNKKLSFQLGEKMNPMEWFDT